MRIGIVSQSSSSYTTVKNNRESGFITSRGYHQSKAHGARLAVKASLSVVSRLPDLCVWLPCLVEAKAGDLSPPAHPKGRIWGLTSLIVNSKHRDQENCGWLALPMYGHEKDSSTRLLSPMRTPAGLSGGHYLIRCGLQALPLQVLNQAIVSAKETSRVGLPL